MGLETYRRKRDFEKTPEPAGRPAADGDSGRDGGWSYVIQKHAATRLHYDFRLELDGVLVSWAVPKGPSLDPKDKHLAVHVEDHPVEYGSFEGTIPPGEYGGGTVLLWDRGTWEPEGDPRRGLAAGELKFTLRGEKLRGGWVLAKMKARSDEEGKDEWLLIKHRDEFAVDGDGQALLRERPESVGSGRVLEEIAAEAEASVWHGDRPADEQPDVRPGRGFSAGTLPAPRRQEGPGAARPRPTGAGHLGGGPASGRRVAPRAEARRLPRPLASAGGSRPHALPERPGLDRAVRSDRRGADQAAGGERHPGRRGRGPAAGRHHQLPGIAGRSGERADRPPALLRVRPDPPGRLRPDRRGHRGAQGGAQTHAGPTGQR